MVKQERFKKVVEYDCNNIFIVDLDNNLSSFIAQFFIMAILLFLSPLIIGYTLMKSFVERKVYYVKIKEVKPKR